MNCKTSHKPLSMTKSEMGHDNHGISSSTVSLSMPPEPRGSYRGSNEFICKYILWLFIMFMFSFLACDSCEMHCCFDFQSRKTPKKKFEYCVNHANNMYISAMFANKAFINSALRRSFYFSDLVHTPSFCDSVLSSFEYT